MWVANIPSGQACGYDSPLPRVYHLTTVEKTCISISFKIVQTHK